MAEPGFTGTPFWHKKRSVAAMSKEKNLVREFMDQQIGELKEGLEHLEAHQTQPTDLGDLYNGMLKNTVTFEIKHMEKLKEELMDLL